MKCRLKLCTRKSVFFLKKKKFNIIATIYCEMFLKWIHYKWILLEYKMHPFSFFLILFYF